MNALKGSRTAKVFAGIALVSASAIVIAGCSSTPSGESGGSDKPAADLTLKLGSLLPQTGSLAFLGPPMESGVGLAVQEVNDAAAGITIDLTAEDEGDTDTKAYETSITKLQGAGVSAIVGAAASGVSKLILDGNVSAGILQISASNTSPDFTTWDDNGLYFRTAPSDLLQGEVLGNLIAETARRRSASSTRTTRTARASTRRSRRPSRAPAARSSPRRRSTSATRSSTPRSRRSRRRTPTRSRSCRSTSSRPLRRCW